MVTDRTCYPQRLTIAPLRGGEITRAPLDAREAAQDVRDVPAFRGKSSAQIERLAVGSYGSLFVLFQLVTGAAQAEGDGMFARAGVRLLPVCGGTVGAGQHHVTLATTIVNRALVERPPAGL